MQILTAMAVVLQAQNFSASSEFKSSVLQIENTVVSGNQPRPTMPRAGQGRCPETTKVKLARIKFARITGRGR